MKPTDENLEKKSIGLFQSVGEKIWKWYERP